MAPETLLQVILLLIAGSWTPGPNNAMLAASGMNFGFDATRPHALGVTIGYGAMIFLVSFGLGGVLLAYPALEAAMMTVSLVLLGYIGFRIATAPVGERVTASGKARRRRPFRFIEAAAFQWVNPKAWALAIGITGLAAGSADNPLAGLIVAALAILVGASSSFGWAAFGSAMTRILSTERRRRVFNLVMAALILIPVAMHLATKILA